MDVKDMIEQLERMPKDAVVVVSGPDYGWDNVLKVDYDGQRVLVRFGGGSPFSSDKS